MTDQFDSQTSEEVARAFEGHIGRFILLWADTERWLFDVLIYYAGVNRKVGRAIFSGARAKQMIDFIGAINANIETDAERVSDLAFLTSQINTINSLRDKIVHHGSYVLRVTPSPETRVIYNAHRAMRKSAEFQWVVDNDLIQAAISDLMTIGPLLMRHPQVPFVRSPRSGDASTWLYRSPQPNGKPKSSGAVASKHPRQPPSSKR